MCASVSETLHKFSFLKACYFAIMIYITITNVLGVELAKELTSLDVKCFLTGGVISILLGLFAELAVTSEVNVNCRQNYFSLHLV